MSKAAYEEKGLFDLNIGKDRQGKQSGKKDTFRLLGLYVR